MRGRLSRQKDLLMNDPLHYDFAVLNRAYFADPGINIHNLDGRQDVGSPQ